jgi:hypothetical protein
MIFYFAECLQYRKLKKQDRAACARANEQRHFLRTPVYTTMYMLYTHAHTCMACHVYTYQGSNFTKKAQGNCRSTQPQFFGLP